MKTTEELKALREEWEHESLPPPNSNRLKAEVLAIIDTALAKQESIEILNKSRNELLTQCDDLRKERDAADCEWLKARAALALLKEPR